MVDFPVFVNPTMPQLKPMIYYFLFRGCKSNHLWEIIQLVKDYRVGLKSVSLNFEPINDCSVTIWGIRAANRFNSGNVPKHFVFANNKNLIALHANFSISQFRDLIKWVIVFKIFLLVFDCNLFHGFIPAS
jgi:hypothetical protein